MKGVSQREMVNMQIKLKPDVHVKCLLHRTGLLCLLNWTLSNVLFICILPWAFEKLIVAQFTTTTNIVVVTK